MKTEIITVDPLHLDQDADKLVYAAEVLKSGGLVAFPTETVYGLGAHALNIKAVGNIFLSKGRPSDNPLIIHIADKQELLPLVSKIPDISEKLIEKFWPGPLTMVFPRSESVPDIITAGLDTVAVRIPAHPVALRLIALARVPVAAPSANSSGRPSPTSAMHVIEDLRGKVDVIIDGGDCRIGIESTVLDVTTDHPLVLRPGGVTPAQIREVLNGMDVLLDKGLLNKSDPDTFIPKAPGMKYTHYAPAATIFVISGNSDKVRAEIQKRYNESERMGIKPGVLVTNAHNRLFYQEQQLVRIDLSDSLELTAQGLFNAFRSFDEQHVGLILAEAVNSEGLGLAVMNRLLKAAGFQVVEV